MPRKPKHIRGQGSIGKRGRIWHITYFVKGQRFRESARTEDYQEALNFLKRRQGHAAAGGALVPGSATVNDLLTLYLDEIEHTCKADSEWPYIAVKLCQKHLRPFFGATKAREFSGLQIQAYIRARKKAEAKPATINREMAILHRAMKLGYQHEPPLIARVFAYKKLPEDNARSGFLKPSQYRKLLEELPEELRLLFVFAYHIGMRRGELLKIRWEQVESDCIRLEGRQAKSSKGRVVPIYGDMRAFLEMQPREGKYLFCRGPVQIKDFRETWRQSCIRAGVPGLLFHDLRRTAVRNMRKAGIDPHLIMNIIGHSTDSMFRRYNIVDENDIKDVGRTMEAWEKEQLIELEPEGKVQ